MIDNASEGKEPKIRLNLLLHGTSAKILIELRSKGIIRTYADGINQAVRLFYDSIIEEQLKSARFHALQASEDE